MSSALPVAWLSTRPGPGRGCTSEGPGRARPVLASGAECEGPSSRMHVCTRMCTHICTHGHERGSLCGRPWALLVLCPPLRPAGPCCQPRPGPAAWGPTPGWAAGWDAGLQTAHRGWLELSGLAPWGCWAPKGLNAQRPGLASAEAFFLVTASGAGPGVPAPPRGGAPCSPLTASPLVQGRGGQCGVRQAPGTSRAAMGGSAASPPGPRSSVESSRAGRERLPHTARVPTAGGVSAGSRASPRVRQVSRPVGSAPRVLLPRRGGVSQGEGPGRLLQRAGSVDDRRGSSGPGGRWSLLECGSAAAGCVPFVKGGVVCFPDLQWGCCQETRHCPPRSSGRLGGGGELGKSPAPDRRGGETAVLATKAGGRPRVSGGAGQVTPSSWVQRRPGLNGEAPADDPWLGGWGWQIGRDPRLTPGRPPSSSPNSGQLSQAAPASSLLPGWPAPLASPPGQPPWPAPPGQPPLASPPGQPPPSALQLEPF